ncbi:MAG: hypothetical protein ABFD79_17270 [Phycisphaerales bacterium]
MTFALIIAICGEQIDYSVNMMYNRFMSNYAKIREMIRSFPTGPGLYFMKDANGTGNLSSDPLFADANDFHLLNESHVLLVQIEIIIWYMRKISNILLVVMSPDSQIMPNAFLLKGELKL